MFRGDLILVARLGGLLGGLAWGLLTLDTIVVPVALAAGVALSGSVLLTLHAARGGPGAARSTALAMLSDLLTTSLWMIANGGNPFALSFVITLITAAAATFRLGLPGLAAGAVAYIVGRVGQEAVRVALGRPTGQLQLFAEIPIAGLALLLTAVAYFAFRDERRRSARALGLSRALGRLTSDITAETDLDAVFRSIVRSAVELVDAQHVTMSVRIGDAFRRVAGAGTGEQVLGVTVPQGLGVIGDVLRERKTVFTDNYPLHPSALPHIVALGVRSVVGLPIMVNGELAACLSVGRSAQQPLDADDVAALEGLAAHATVALRNARLRERAQALERLSLALVREGAPENMIEQVAIDIERTFHVDFVNIMMLEDGLCRTVASRGAAEPLRHLVDEHPGPLVRAVRERRAVVAVRDMGVDLARLDDTLRDRGTGTSETLTLARAVGARAAIAAPIVVDDQVTAAVVVSTTDQHRYFDDADRQDVLAFAQALGVALQAAAFRRDRDRRAHRLTLLNVVGAELSLIQDPSEVAQRAFEAAGELMTRDAFYIGRYDQTEGKIIFLLRADDGVVDLTIFETPLGDGPSSRVIRTRAPYLVSTPDDPVQSRGQRFGDEAKHSAAAVHVPLWVGGEIVGVLSSQSYTAKAYDREDVEILQSLANLVGSAFENADRIAETRELYLASVRALAAAVDARDPYTRSHSARVAVIARRIGQELALSEEDLRRVQLAALLHDIGKIGIPDAILTKAAPLSDDEWVLMRTHPSISGAILGSVEPLRDLVPIVVAHHERFDGTGYPSGTSGDDIPLTAAIVGAAEAFETILGKRAYKNAGDAAAAEEQLRSGRGTQFRPEVADALLRLLEDDRRKGSPFLQSIVSIEHDQFGDLTGAGGIVRRYALSSQSHGRQLAMLQRLAMQIASVLDLDDLCRRLLVIIGETMAYDNARITVYDAATDELVVRAGNGQASTFTVGQRLPRGSGLSWAAIDAGRTLNLPDVSVSRYYRGAPEMRSALIVPLRVGDELVGALGLRSSKPAAFGREDEELLEAISHQVAAALQVARLHDETKQAASTDPLTSLPNRRIFFERLADALAKRETADAPVSVVMMDVNGLKALNDRWGHAAGDEALVRVGEILAAGVRGEDVVARIGGDEYGIVFPGAPLPAAQRVMRRLAENVASGTLADGRALPTISWGVAAAPLDGATPDALVEVADGAMYRHKQLSGHQRLA